MILALATGFGGGLESPFIFTVMIALVVVAFGWGYLAGAIGLAIGWGAMVGGIALGSADLAQQYNDQRDLTIVLTMLLAVLTSAAVRSRLMESERRRIALAGQVESLSEANGLLTLVNSVARTLPTSLTLREALHTAQRQIADTFDARVVCLLTLDENAEEWVPKLAEGCELRPAYRTADLPGPLADALRNAEPVLRSDLEEIDESQRLVGEQRQRDLRPTRHPRLDHRPARTGAPRARPLRRTRHPRPGRPGRGARPDDRQRAVVRPPAVARRGGGAGAPGPRPARPTGAVAHLHRLRAGAHHGHRDRPGG